MFCSRCSGQYRYTGREYLPHPRRLQYPVLLLSIHKGTGDFLSIPQRPRFLYNMRIFWDGCFERKCQYTFQASLKLAAILLPQPPRNYNHPAQLKKSCFKQVAVITQGYPDQEQDVACDLGDLQALWVLCLFSGCRKEGQAGKREPFPIFHSLFPPGRPWNAIARMATKILCKNQRSDSDRKPCKCQGIGMHELYGSQEGTVPDFLRDKEEVEKQRKLPRGP